MIDPATGKLVSSDEMIKLKGGRTVQAGPYSRELNAIEKQLNASGYSLRAAIPLKTNVPQHSTELQLQRKEFQDFSDTHLYKLPVDLSKTRSSYRLFTKRQPFQHSLSTNNNFLQQFDSRSTYQTTIEPTVRLIVPSQIPREAIGNKAFKPVKNLFADTRPVVLRNSNGHYNYNYSKSFGNSTIGGKFSAGIQLSDTRQ